MIVRDWLYELIGKSRQGKKDRVSSFGQSIDPWLGHDWYGGGTATTPFDSDVDVPECTCDGCKDMRAKMKGQGEDG